MNRPFIFLSFGAGLLLAAIGFAKLRQSGDALRHDRNPFAIQQSGFGKTLARLSQDTIDVVWHLGIEQVNPIGHHHGHDGEEEHPGSGEHHEGWLEEAKDWLQDLRAARYDRTNPLGTSLAHQKTVAADIEKMLLRSYRMDPTNYGAYSGYFIFLTIHDLRATEVSRDQARLISRHTVAEAMKEDVDPQAWITACAATLNLFLLDMEDAKVKGERLPVAVVEDHRRRMAHCLQGYSVLKEKAIAEGRWEQIPLERRESMLERERFSLRYFEQFDAVLARSAERKEQGGQPEPAAGEGGVVTGPVEAGEPGREER